MKIVHFQNQYCLVNDIGEVAARTSEFHEAFAQATSELGPRGGAVHLSRGQFVLRESLEIPDNVSVIGEGQSSELIVAKDNVDGVGLRVQGKRGILLENFLVRPELGNKETHTGLFLDDCGDSKLRGVRVLGFKDYGLKMCNNCFLCTVSDCTFAGNGKANVFMRDLARGKYGEFVPNTLNNCVIYGGGRGIHCHKVLVANITSCLVYQTNDDAFYFENWTCSVVVSGCRTFQITGNAFYADTSHELNLTGNIFCWTIGHSVNLNNCAWGTISGNEFIDTGSYNPGGPNFTLKIEDHIDDAPLVDAIVLNGVKGFQVGGNAIFNWPITQRMNHAVVEDESSLGNIIANNTINYYAADEAVISAGKDTLVKDNVAVRETHNPDGNTEGWIQTYRPELTQQFIDEMISTVKVEGVAINV